MRPKILIVDDNIDHAESMALLLETAGYGTVIETDVKKVFKLAAEVRPDVITTDINMPEMDGFEVARLLKENPATKDITILLHSATSEIGGAFKKAIEAGADDFIRIPAERLELIARFNVCISRAEAIKKLKETEGKFNAVVETARDAIIMIDSDDGITFWNKGAELTFGYTSDEVIGKELHDFIVPRRYHDVFKKGFEHFKRTGEGAAIGTIIQLEGVKKDGSEIPVELSLSAIKIKENWCAVGILRDISARIKMEIDLKNKIKEMEKFQKVTMDREKRIIELKEEIKELKKRYGL